MNPIKKFKLISGELILAEVLNSTESHVALKYPMEFSELTSTDGTLKYFLKKFMGPKLLDRVLVNPHAVVAISELDKDMMYFYAETIKEIQAVEADMTMTIEDEEGEEIDPMKFSGVTGTIKPH